jgi:RNA recognition motif-containing protein
VGSLPWSVTDEELKETFEKHGNVVSAKVVTDRNSGRSRGFGFVEMESAEDASKAMGTLNDSEMGGRNIVVNEAKARD